MPNTSSQGYDVPILLIVFNRPNETRQLIKALRKVKPRRIYVAADGPRSDHNELEQCIETRSVIGEIDWPCEMHSIFRDENLGCKIAPAKALDWFFENEPEGIILEDDCIPHSDFFTYARWALENYREDKKVWHINGNNFNAPENLYKGKPIAFTALAQVWGWATWADRWKKYTLNPFNISQEIDRKSESWQLTSLGRLNKLMHIGLLKSGLDAWDYQWQATVLNHGGLSISSASNLISNIGDGPASTHTRYDNRTHLETQSISGKLEHLEPVINKDVHNWYENKMGMRRKLRLGKHISKKLVINIIQEAKSKIANYVIKTDMPIFIASTGRAGSTMLFEAVSKSYIQHRFERVHNPLVKNLLIRSGGKFVPRLKSGFELLAVNKTHDLFDQRAPANAKYIFVFGNPLESARSVEKMMEKHGEIWLDQHLYHLRSSGDKTELYEKDILNYEAQIESWIFNNNNENCLRLHYEELWEKQEEISKFLGFPVSLPPKKERQKKHELIKYNEELFSHLESVERRAREFLS